MELVQGNFDNIDENGQLICPICREKGFRRLARHTSQVHGVKSYELREKGYIVVTDEESERMSKNASESYSEKSRQIHSEVMKKLLKNPEFKKSQIEATKSMFDDQDYREAFSKRKSEELKQRWKENPEQMMQYCYDSWTPKRREAHSKFMSEYWIEHYDELVRVLAEGRTEETYKKMSEAMYRRWEDPQYREQFSLMMIERWKTNKEFREVNRLPHDRYQYTSSQSGKTYNMRSSWEVVLASYLDESQIPYTYEEIIVPYISQDDQTIHNYFPDFYLPQYNLVLEVKPECFIEDELVQLKMRATIALGYSYEFITENNINDLQNQIPLLLNSYLVNQ